MNRKRLYISADMEGVAGVTSLEQLGPKGFEYEKARAWMTNEVITACHAAFEFGVKEIVISDSHANAQNLLLDKLPPGVQVVRAWPRPLCMMQGIEQGHFDAALLIGYHPGASDLRGVVAHTLSLGFRELKLNGRVASESVLSAAIAGHFNVPVVMVSGDDAYTAHAQEVFPGIEAATVKWAESFTSTRTLLPKDACQLIEEKVKAALNRLEDFSPYLIEGPITVDIKASKRQNVELLDYLPLFTRTGAFEFQFEGKDIVEVSRILMFLVKNALV